MAEETRRHLDLDGSYNIRDIGGYRTADGRHTRWGTFLRADSLHRLPAASQAALIDYGIRTVVDLRQTQALAEQPDVFADSPEVAYFHHNIIGDDGPVQQTEADAMEVLRSADRIVLVYSSWLDGRQRQFRDTLQTLATPEARPALYHCAGGKDRTGIISALLLGIAGVPADTIAEDYALTARYLWERFVNEPAPPEATASVQSWEEYQREFCPPEAMLGTLEHLSDRYGGIEAYMQTIGLTNSQIDSLRDALLD